MVRQKLPGFLGGNPLTGDGTLGAGLPAATVDASVGLVTQGEGSSVQGHSENQLVLGHATSRVVLHSPVLCREGGWVS